jgi:A/G-specific adenine glycosylase
LFRPHLLEPVFPGYFSDHDFAKGHRLTPARSSPPRSASRALAVARRKLSRQGFAAVLLDWYNLHGRALPWREDRDPYRVWLSEVMLQQTRVAAVLDHYRKFLKKFPDLQKLAKAREASVLAAWSGLGYYRRARMLHAAAKIVMKEYGGEFPRTTDGLRELPGIGRYTAAAIASIAFDEPVAVVDGNVERVLARLEGRRLDGERLWQSAQSLLEAEPISRTRPGDFNQAMMELGATICVPGPPKCLTCPVAQFCATRGELAASSPKVKQKKRSIVYGLARRKGEVGLVQRAEIESLMAGMWELPQIESANGSHPTLLELRHSITVTDYAVRVVASDGAPGNAGKWFAESRLPALALTGLARKILRRSGLI